jgi:hypothetical protein
MVWRFYITTVMMLVEWKQIFISELNNNIVVGCDIRTIQQLVLLFFGLAGILLLLVYY